MFYHGTKASLRAFGDAPVPPMILAVWDFNA